MMLGLSILSLVLSGIALVMSVTALVTTHGVLLDLNRTKEQLDKLDKDLRG